MIPVYMPRPIAVCGSPHMLEQKEGRRFLSCASGQVNLQKKTDFRKKRILSRPDAALEILSTAKSTKKTDISQNGVLFPRGQF